MNNNGGGLFDEPRQQPGSQHIISDERSRVWLETPDTSVPKPNYPARVSASVCWVAFSAIVFKLVRILSSFVPLPVLLLVIGFLLLPIAAIAYKQSSDDDGRFKALFNSLLIVAGIVIGGL